MKNISEPSLNQQIINALHTVIDPELGYNIMDLGLVYEIHAGKGQVNIKMSMTTPGCPAQDYIVAGVRHILGTLSGIQKIHVQVVWEPQWHPGLMSEKAKTHFGVTS
ncbi:MAG: metal-sulfur cluster assembly factor [Proteobacteria bacterium]|nr:metal-sulfur cluster assembly factor [Pseudomonadota bacterium]